jgi:hypothetical protein
MSEEMRRDHLHGRRGRPKKQGKKQQVRKQQRHADQTNLGNLHTGQEQDSRDSSRQTSTSSQEAQDGSYGFRGADSHFG